MLQQRHKGLVMLPQTSSLDMFRPAQARRRARVAEEIPNKHRFRPVVCMFIGRRGGGKTEAMSIIAKFQKRRNLARGAQRTPENPDGFAIAANYKLVFADYLTPFLVDDLMRFQLMGGDASPFHLQVNIDEAAANFPSRRSMARENVDFSNLLTQIRKLNSDMNFTTQFPQVMDLQILWQVDLFIRCRTPDFGKTIFLDYYDWWGQWTGRDFRKPWPPQPGWSDWSKVLRNCHLIWGEYDTREYQAPIWSKYRDKILAAGGWDIIEGDASDEPKRTRNELRNGPERPAKGGKPKTVTEALMQAGAQFAILSQLPILQELDENLNSFGRIRDYLKEQGYDIRKRGGTWLAFAPAPGIVPEGS